MPRANVAGKDKPETASSTPRLALSIAQFCESHNISAGFYYKLKGQGIGPCEVKLGTRTLITFEAAAKWRAEREATSTAPAEKAPAKRERATQRRWLPGPAPDSQSRVRSIWHIITVSATAPVTARFRFGGARRDRHLIVRRG